MYFNRQYKAGGRDYDPRQRHWAEFICSNCGHIEDVDIGGGKAATFDFSRERLCPKCRTYGPADYKKNLMAEIDKLTADRNRIDIQIEECQRKINEVENKEIEK